MTHKPLLFPDRCSSGFAWVVLGIIALGLGILLGNAATLALGVTLLVLPGMVYLGLRLSMRGLRVTRVAPRTAFEEDSVSVQLDLTNSGRWPAFYPMVSEIFPPEIYTQKDLLFGGHVIPGEEIRHAYQGHCLLPRGIYELGRPTIRLQDPFGWFERTKTALLRETVQIYPSIVDTDSGDAVGRALEQIVPNLTSHKSGASTDLLGVREYRAGDSLRHIAWALTARRGMPIVRTFERHSSGQLCLLLDLTRDALVGLGRNSSLELGIKLAAALSAHALQENRQVKLIAGGFEESDWGSGDHHLTALLDILSRIRIQNDDPPLDQLCLEQQQRQPQEQRGTWVVMVSPYLYDSGEFHQLPLTQRLLSLQQQGQRVWVVLFDESTFPQLRGFRSSTELERGRDYATYLRQLDLEVCVLPCGADLEAGLHGVAS